MTNLIEAAYFTAFLNTVWLDLKQLQENSSAGECCGGHEGSLAQCSWQKEQTLSTERHICEPVVDLIDRDSSVQTPERVPLM